jgi:hypothetical protein
VIYVLLMILAVTQPKDGSVIFLHGGVLVKPIEKHTGSQLTHAAIILYDKGPQVYEATWPRVRKTPLDQYFRLLETEKRKHPELTWFIVQPTTDYTPTQLASIKQYAKSQIGRPYKLNGWWKGKETRGIFCSQYVANALEKSGRIKSANFKESPVSLREKLRKFYQ